jgi:hypothetical protein
MRDMATTEQLQTEIDKFRKEIRSESYPMSIGEIMSLYEDRELDLHPEFQRFFRWTDLQKTRLIESILLGIPLPAIFLVQRDDGVLDVVDGLQRLSTIFRFLGVLRDEEDKVIEPPLRLQSTKYLPSLENVVWELPEPDEEIGRSGPQDASERIDDDETVALSTAQRLVFKRAKLNLIILERLSDPDAKYELFQRLNTGGSELSDQEVRNCVLLMINRPFFLWMQGLADLPDFANSLTLTDRKQQERYDLELVVRFLVMATLKPGLSGPRDLGEFLTDEIVELAKAPTYDQSAVGSRFAGVMNVLNESLGSDAFLPYRPDRDAFSGGFSVAAFEAITYGVGENLSEWQQLSREESKTRLRERVKAMWQDNEQWRVQTGTGIRAENRLPFVVKYAPDHYRP